MERFDINYHPTDEQAKKTDQLIQDLFNDSDVRKLNLPEKVIRTSPWRIDSWRRERKLCEGCTGLNVCRQKKCGYRSEIVYDGVLQTVKAACPFMNTKLQKERHMKKYLICDLPQSMRANSFQQIDETKEPASFQKALFTALDCLTRNKGLFLYGDMGTGKTHLAACAANAYAREGKSVCFVFWPLFVQRMASGVATGECKTDFERMKFADFVVIDDIGAESVTEWNRDQLLLPILNARYEAGLPVWFTSNEDLSSLREHFALSNKGKEEVMKAERIIERIQVMVKSQALTGQDRRKNVD